MQTTNSSCFYYPPKNVKSAKILLVPPKMQINYDAIQQFIFSNIAIAISAFSLLLFVKLQLLIVFASFLVSIHFFQYCNSNIGHRPFLYCSLLQLLILFASFLVSALSFLIKFSKVIAFPTFALFRSQRRKRKDFRYCLLLTFRA